MCGHNWAIGYRVIGCHGHNSIPLLGPSPQGCNVLQSPCSFLFFASFLGLAPFPEQPCCCTTCVSLAVPVGCANQCSPVSSCVRLYLWQPIALVSLILCTPCCLHEAIQTVYINSRDSSCNPHSQATQSSFSWLLDRSHISTKRYSELSIESSKLSWLGNCCP